MEYNPINPEKMGEIVPDDPLVRPDRPGVMGVLGWVQYPGNFWGDSVWASVGKT
jgi:hypothetical protein